MLRTPRFATVGLPMVLVCVAAIVVGCGGGGSAAPDPVSRAQTESDAKNAMATSSKKQSDGASTQNSKAAMDAAARKQNKSGK